MCAATRIILQNKGSAAPFRRIFFLSGRPAHCASIASTQACRTVPAMEVHTLEP